MTTQHPSPSPEIIEEILEEVSGLPGTACHEVLKRELVKKAYVQGADAELDACVDWIRGFPHCATGADLELLQARRPDLLAPPAVVDRLTRLQRLVSSREITADRLAVELKEMAEELSND